MALYKWDVYQTRYESAWRTNFVGVVASGNAASRDTALNTVLNLFGYPVDNNQLFTDYYAGDSANDNVGLYGATSPATYLISNLSNPGTYYFKSNGSKDAFSVRINGTAITISRLTKVYVDKAIATKGTYIETITATYDAYRDNADNNGKWYVRGGLSNEKPTLTLTSPTANQILRENQTLTIAGNARDTNANDVITIKYQINGGTVRNLHTAISDGVNTIPFTQNLVYRNGKLHLNDVAITDNLNPDVPHTINVWAEDNNSTQSDITMRSFLVIPNQAPTLTIAPLATQTGLINQDVISVQGTVNDLEGSDVTVTFAINGGTEYTAYSGPSGNFSFTIAMSLLRNGENTVVVKSKDNYQATSTKTLKITKGQPTTAVKKGVVRYEIEPPSGDVKRLYLWLTRTVGSLDVQAEIALKDGIGNEVYAPLTKTTTTKNGFDEDAFEHEFADSTENKRIILKVTYDKSGANVGEVIRRISGSVEAAVNLADEVAALQQQVTTHLEKSTQYVVATSPTQTIQNNTEQDIAWNSSYNVNGANYASVAAGKIKLKKGTYLVFVSTRFTGNDTGYRRLSVNNLSIVGYKDATLQCNYVIDVATNDVELPCKLYQNSGTALSTADGATLIRIYKVGG